MPDIRAAAAAGMKNIFCEKPVGVSLEETEEICRICKEYGVNIGVGYKMRFEGIFAMAHSLVSQGRIGELVSISLNFYQAIPHSSNWYLDSGFIREAMVHPLDLACWFAGADPECVMCTSENFAGGKREDRGIINPAVCKRLYGVAQRGLDCGLSIYLRAEEYLF